MHTSSRLQVIGEGKGRSIVDGTELQLFHRVLFLKYYLNYNQAVAC